MPHCHSCEAAIIWSLSQRGKRMPFDAEPITDWTDLRGLWVIRDGVALPATTALPLPEEPVYKSHFATCPHANQHRRERASASS